MHVIVTHPTAGIGRASCNWKNVLG